jgi:hypothetical protein
MNANNPPDIAIFVLIVAGVGFALGLIPLIAGLVKGGGKHIGLGVGGFFATLVSGAICGLILGLPVSIIFLVLIIKTPKEFEISRRYVDSDDAYGDRWRERDDRGDYDRPRRSRPNYGDETDQGLTYRPDD